MIKRLLPLVEQFAPGDMTAAVRGHLDMLKSLVSDNTRQRDDEWLQKGLRPETRVEEQEQSILDRIDHAGSSAQRDNLYFQLAFMSLRRDDLRARDFVDRI